MSSTYDPFLAPNAATPIVETDLVPASLGERFVAKIVDNLSSVGTFVPAGVVMAVVGGPEAMEESAGAMAIGMLGVLITLALMLGLFVLQCVWLSTRGQSVGKRAVGIHVAKVDGSPVDFVSAVVLRTWVPGLVIGVANQVCLGWVLVLIDIAPAFGDGRCIHDHIAGTKVLAGMPAHLQL